MWQYVDQESLSWMAQAGNPPGDIGSVLADPGWATIFMRWADEHCMTVAQDVDLQHRSLFIVSVHDGASLGDLYDEYAHREAPHLIEWNDLELVSDFSFGREDANNEASARPRLWENCVQYLGQYYDPFVADVYALTAVSDPVLVENQEPAWDYAVIDGLNKRNLKDAPARTSLDFLQCREAILIGDGHPTPYVNYASNAGQKGRVIVVSRGIGGRIQVVDAWDPDSFKAYIKANDITDKKMEFVSSS